MNNLSISLQGKSYDIHFGFDLIDSSSSILNSLKKIKCKVYIITDKTVAPLYLDRLSKSFIKDGYETFSYIINPGEESKSFKHVDSIVNDMTLKKLTRTDIVVALGGGVVGDLAGFISSIYLRGVDFIQIPTTLLAQVDSSVGGKVAINLPGGKNLIGSFYNPIAVIIDINCLRTLSDRDFTSGMAEVIKYGCIYDRDLFDILKKEPITKSSPSENILRVVRRCCEIKSEYVTIDPFDKGKRMELNFGHTIGHAIENRLGYGIYQHGEAVAIGMVVESHIGELLGITATGTTLEIRDLLLAYNLPIKFNYDNSSQFNDALKLDKKNLDNNLKFVFLRNIGEAFIQDISVDKISSLLSNYGEQAYDA